jgi:hypothetical protein
VAPSTRCYRGIHDKPSKRSTARLLIENAEITKRILAQQHKTFVRYYLQQSHAGAFYKVYKVYKKKALSQEV